MSKPAATTSTKPAQKPQKQNPGGQPQQFPTCMNKNQAKLVCLNPKCQQHAFFCTECQNDQCQIIHQHGGKLLSVSFKQYIKKVLKQRKLDPQLEYALKNYMECLQKLRKDVQEFVQKQMAQIQQIKKKALEMQEEQQKIIQKLRKKQYTGLKGTQLDNLWQKVSQQQNKDKLKDTIQFLSIKMQEIKQISDNFQKVNKMELDDFIDDGSEDKGKDNNKQKGKIDDKGKVTSASKDVKGESKGGKPVVVDQGKKKEEVPATATKPAAKK